jgi:hypothetical protein
MRGKRVLVCGGRDFRDYSRLSKILTRYHTEISAIGTVIHGGASGADSLAGKWAGENGIPVEVFPAQWKKYGNSAGPIRNHQMLEEGLPDIVIAFPGGKGTAHMVGIARAADVFAIEVPLTSEEG